MESLYFDNAATSWPKPPQVIQAVTEYWQSGAAYGSLGRSTSRGGDRIATLIAKLRDQLAELIGAASAKEIAFCGNATDALNLLIHGFVLHHKRHSDPGPLRVLTSHAEHNSVLRPLNSWVSSGDVQLELVPCLPGGAVDVPAAISALETKPIDLVCLIHGSNVTGVINRLSSVGQVCKRKGIPFLVDAAQTVGHIPVSVADLQCDFLVAAGHKGLGGPLGTGFFYARSDLAGKVDSLRVGGTGTASEAADGEIAPPAKWEAGNPNLPGLIGLAAAVPLLLNTDEMERREGVCRRLAERIWDGLHSIQGISLLESGQNPFGGSSITSDTATSVKSELSETGRQRLPIISCVSDLLDPATISEAISQAGIVTRSGYHCAPWIHQALGTEVGGTLRISPGPENTFDQVETLIETVSSVFKFN